MSTITFQPDRLNTANVYLLVDDVNELIRFVESVLGGQLRFKLNRPDGRIMHAEIIIGDSTIMAGEPMTKGDTFPASIYVYVRDCDAIFQKALNYGAISVMEPATMHHAGERSGGVKDSQGNLWWIATHLEDLTPEEQAARIS